MWNQNYKIIIFQTSLSKICSEINERLSIFNAVNSIQLKLDSPSFIVTSEMFANMMTSIDNGIQYINAHVHIIFEQLSVIINIKYVFYIDII